MRIGELAEITGTTPKTLRFYEEQGLLPAAARTAAGYRDYPRRTAERIGFIHRGKAAGLTLAQIRTILEVRDRGEAPCGHVRGLLSAERAELDRRIAELQDLRQAVAALEERAADVDPAACRADQVCQYL
ncbi:heavy metal-responsive transcriptional regulator [Nesterenkonia sp. PF2B19]|uniref:heavy metal-responsive transcriptional regulator n=1 Tax=unclassified Nesterenkonia TaxID=2629769 RepID=UPI000872538E|nr:heavy metal-responsive transcriptional regulator [Nesterenkonia sp. PF2B19]OSM43262.1 heavy metal-responsive transcriptional regulator [Nesterenkonia sp. PF2B19]